jgi:hypothetical protein
MSQAVGRLGQTNVDAIGGMTLFGTLGLEAVLRPDGSVWFEEDLDWTGPTPRLVWRRATAQEAAGALLRAVPRHPLLGELLPSRTEGTPPCSRCAGNAQMTSAGRVFEGIWCEACYGVGWLIALAI